MTTEEPTIGLISWLLRYDLGVLLHYYPSSPWNRNEHGDRCGERALPRHRCFTSLKLLSSNLHTSEEPVIYLTIHPSIPEPLASSTPQNARIRPNQFDKSMPGLSLLSRRATMYSSRQIKNQKSSISMQIYTRESRAKGEQYHR